MRMPLGTYNPFIQQIPIIDTYAVRLKEREHEKWWPKEEKTVQRVNGGELGEKSVKQRHLKMAQQQQQ